MIKLDNWTFKKHILLSLVLTLLTMIDEILTLIILPLSSFVNGIVMSMHVARVGVIGGADGPTAVFYSDGLFRSSLYTKIFVFIVYLFLYKPTKNYINKKWNFN